jgi:DNA-directed RNA polymerase subunit RPC12/RpoP
MIKRFCDKCGREIKLYLRIITISKVIDDRKFEKPETEKVLELCQECSEKILKLKK